MTIKINLSCDGNGCCNSTEILADTDPDIEHAGYHTDHIYGEFHYCSTCWPKVKKELDKE